MNVRKCSYPGTLVSLFLAFLTFCSVTTVEAEPAPEIRPALARLEAASSSKADVMHDDRFGTISWLKGSYVAALPHDPVESSYRFMESHADAFSIDSPREEFALLLSKEDLPLGTKHVYFDQKLNGVPVWGHRIGFHYNRSNVLYAANGKYSPTMLLLSTVPSLRPVDAIEAAITALRKLPHTGMTSNGNGHSAGSSDETIVFDRGMPPSAELVFYPDTAGDLHLAYCVRIGVTSPPGYWLFFVDALNGDVLFKYDNIQTVGPVTGSGIDLFGNTVPLYDYLDTDGKFKLIDTTKYMYTHHTTSNPNSTWEGVIEVRDSNHAVDANNQPVLNPNCPVVSDPNGDNVFDDNGNTDPKSNYRAAVSLAKTFSEVYDFMYTALGRNSVDGNGFPIIGSVHFGVNYQNAFWNGQYKMMFFGDNAAGSLPYSISTDAAAHEFCHGVTNFEVPPEGLIYINQSGALNEAISDMFGVSVDNDDWQIGEDLGTPMRYFDDPSKGNQPKDMYNLFMAPIDVPLELGSDHGGVHINSGIANYAFYLMSQNLPVIPPASDGRITAFKIVYRSYVYLAANPNATFKDWDIAMKQSAIDLFGPGAEFTAVSNALNTVRATRARVVSYDNGQIFDQQGKYDFLQMKINGGAICGSVLIDRPSTGSVLKTVEVSFAGFHPTNQNDVIDPAAVFDVYLCPLATDNSPYEAGCGYLDPALTKVAKAKVNGIFTLLPIPALPPLPSQFHVAVCYDGGGWSYANLLVDNGTASAGRSWARVYSVVNSNYYWTTDLSSLVTHPGGNLLIRAIFEEPASGAAPAPPVLESPANGFKVSATQATLTWNASNGADRYFLEVNSSNAWTANTRKFFAVVNTTSQNLTGLPNDGTIFYWRVYAGTVDAWSAASGTFSFTNGDAPVISKPTVTTTAATAVTIDGATLNGTVNANNASTAATFEYGLTAAYGSTAAAIPGTVAGEVNTAVSAVITGLEPDKTYHYRAKGVNSAGTTTGNALTFKTAACPAVQVVNIGVFASLPLAYAASPVQATSELNLRNVNHTAVAFDQNKTVILRGGYSNCDLSARSGFSTIIGPVNIAGGMVIFDDIDIN